MPPAVALPSRTPHLHVVTGKGGVGKTTVAVALAMALARRGGRTLVIEVEGRQGIASLCNTAKLDYTERRITKSPSGGEVYGMAVDAEDALLDYLAMFYKLGRAGKALRHVGAIDFATTIAPGLRDILLTGKVKEATTRSRDGKRVYDAVVLDAPPTGRVSQFLNVTVEASKLAKVGPIRSHSDGVARLLHSDRTAVHLVTRLEDMPVQETKDAVTQLTALKLPVGTIVMNAATPRLLEGADVTPEGLRDQLEKSELSVTDALVDGLFLEVKRHQRRVGVQDALRDELGKLPHPNVELPLIVGGMDASALRTLANTLASGMKLDTQEEDA